MGVVVGWRQCETLSPETWAALGQDVRRVWEAYPAELQRRRMQERASASWLSRFLMPPIPFPPYVLGLDGQGLTAEAIELLPPLGQGRGGFFFTDENQSWACWRIEREAGEGWCKPYGGWHDELLLATLALLETHAPGTVLMTQNDYDQGGTPSFQTMVRAWVEPVIGRPLAWPAWAPDAPGDHED
jgi:hypothetical protein